MKSFKENGYSLGAISKPFCNIKKFLGGKRFSLNSSCENKYFKILKLGNIAKLNVQALVLCLLKLSNDLYQYVNVKKCVFSFRPTRNF